MLVQSGNPGAAEESGKKFLKDNGEEEDELGTEVDLKITYELVEGLNLDVVGAYLFAGDATGEDDPIEVGSRLSLSF